MLLDDPGFNKVLTFVERKLFYKCNFLAICIHLWHDQGERYVLYF
jgi:hypothetical protein